MLPPGSINSTVGPKMVWYVRIRAADLFECVFRGRILWKVCRGKLELAVSSSGFSPAVDSRTDPIFGCYSSLLLTGFADRTPFGTT